MRGAMAGPTACRTCGRGLERHGGRSRVFCKECAAKADREIARKPRVKCKECGKKFAAASRIVRYCSRGCRAEFARRYNREYQRKLLADPEKRAIILARTRASAAARRARKRGGRPPQRQPPMRVDPNAEPSVCRLCGRGFAQYGRTNRHVYCRQCTARADREIAKKLRVKCKECGKAFTTTKRSVRYCSDECSAEGVRRSRRRSNARRLADPERHAARAAYMRARSAARGGSEPGG